MTDEQEIKLAIERYLENVKEIGPDIFFSKMIVVLVACMYDLLNKKISNYDDLKEILINCLDESYSMTKRISQ